MSRPNGSNSDWTPEKEDIVRRNWGHKSAAKIGEMIDMNKNQVIGKAHRLELKLPETKRSRKRARAPFVRRVMRASVSGCQWIEAEPKERQFCGVECLPGSSYCAEHHERCWIDPRDYRSEAA